MSGAAEGTIHYLNADFDLSLRHRPEKLTQPAIRKAVQALTVQGLLAGGGDDAVLVKAGIPEDFLSSLARLGIGAPRILRHPEADRKMFFRPFGWNAEAISINAGQVNPSHHPSLEVIRRVNSRAFSSELERNRLGGSGVAPLFDSTAALTAWLNDQDDTPGGWVVKANHGNAGLGNRRLRGRELDRNDRKFIDELFAEDGAAVVEPWRRRLTDLCTVFALEPSGEIRGRRFHETVYTVDGALVGAIFESGESRWQEQIDEVVEVVAAELSSQRYFGPVSFDSFLFREGDEMCMRPLADLNCRRPMSDAIYSFWRDRLGDRALYWRFFNTRKLRPDVVEEIERGDDYFCPGRRRGVLPTSPWTIELSGTWVRAPKLAVAFVGEGKDDALRMEGAFRARFER